jgi:GntR family transcriptional regulator/MocR family aminotransferase
VHPPTTAPHDWLCTALRAEILDGRLRAGARLPSTRDLARQYGLSRGTIVTAFDQLEAEGYLTGRPGSGTYVGVARPDDFLQARARSGEPLTADAPRRRRWSDAARRARPFPTPDPRRPRAFRPHLPAIDLFPTTLWGQLVSRRFRRASAALLRGCGPMGYAPLQDAVAAYLATSRGVVCRPEQVAIVSGAQEALDLITRLFVNPGDRVCLEEPGYVGAALVFQAAGARVVHVGVDDEGVRPMGPASRGARLAYVTPAHQYPLGVSLDRHGSVVFVGTFSKVLFPALRLGYCVVPPDLVDRVAAVKSVSSRHAPVLDQAVLCDFMTEGHFGRHVRRMREIYAERRDVLLASARERLHGLLAITGMEAGLQSAAWFEAPIDGEAAARGAASRNVEVTPLSRYFARRPSREGLHLGFAAVDAPEIRRGVRELAGVLEAAVRGRRFRAVGDRGTLARVTTTAGNRRKSRGVTQ